MTTSGHNVGLEEEKPMNDTPRTDAAWKTTPSVYDFIVEMKRIERELNAANDRIQSLIEERDRANRLAELKWNLRDEFELLLGTSNIEEGIEAVKELKRRIKRLEEFVDQLTNPKFTRDDLPKEALLQRIKRLEEAGDRIIEAGWSVQDWSGMCVVWAKAKEDKL